MINQEQLVEAMMEMEVPKPLRMLSWCLIVAVLENSRQKMPSWRFLMTGPE